MMKEDEMVLGSEEMKGYKKVIKRVKEWLADEDKNEWLKDMRGMLSLVATVIATLTFQSVINPPGGVRPAKDDNDIKCPDNITDTNPCPGQAVLAVVYSYEYTIFLGFNTTCFISSLAVCLLLISGLPLNNKFVTRLLSIGMCIIISSLTLTYMYGVQMVTPNPVWTPTNDLFEKAFYVWISLLGLVTLFLILRLILWIFTKCCFAGHKPC